MYDQETSDQSAQEASPRHQGEADVVRYAHGKHNPVHLRIGYGNQLYVGFMGKGSGQRRDLQDDFTRFFYSYRRHDWIPVWYQAHAE